MQDDTQTTGNVTPSAEDTVNTQTSEANLQEVQAPDVAQTLEENASELIQEDTASEKLYAGKYKSPEDMEKAYNELQSKYTSTSQEKAELSRILTGAFVPPQTTNATPQMNVANEYTEYEQPDQRDVELQQLKTQSAIQSFILTHDNVDVGSLDEVLRTDPLVKDIPSASARLEYAYLRSQNMTKSQAIAEAEQQAVRQTQVKVVEKQAAQVEQVQRSQQPDQKAERAARIRNGDLNATAEAINELPAIQEMKRLAGLSE